jgi:hypothetical protein
MKYLTIILKFIRENSWFKIIIILSLLFIFVLIINFIINKLKDKIVNYKLKMIVIFIKRPLLITFTVLCVLFYIRQSEVLFENYNILRKISYTILVIYYFTIVSNLNKIFFFPIIKKILKTKKIEKDILVLIEKII